MFSECGLQCPFVPVGPPCHAIAPASLAIDMQGNCKENVYLIPAAHPTGELGPGPPHNTFARVEGHSLKNFSWLHSQTSSTARVLGTL